jgi:hemin uptake protein HemP
MNVAGDEEETANKNLHAPISAGLERRLTMAGNRLDSRDLFVGTREVVIVHGRDEYRLRLTAQNKLILTK